MQNSSDKQFEDNICRCGHDKKSNEPHPCHWQDYTCRKPSLLRFILNNAGLSGSTPKFGANDTWACDDHWEEYKRLMKSEKLNVEPLSREHESNT